MMAKILVVDDEVDMELLIKQKFRKKIRENVYEFVFARNGVEALAKLKEHPDVDVVLSDINMPEMDGLTLLSKLPEASPIIKTVIVSAYGDMVNIRTAMNRGAFDFVCKPIDFDDLDLTVAKTIEHVVQLRKTLQAIKENNILKMYVDESVLNFMTHQEFENSLLVNEAVEASIMFVDICCFTAIAEHVSANTVVNLLNKIFDLMVHEIIEQKGRVDKFLGDAVMAVFRDKYHLDRCVEAALAIRKRLKAFEETLPDNSVFRPEVSIGINSGEVISGNIGSASLRRLDYTVIGDTVNVAQRLQSIAQPGQIVVTHKAYEQIKESFCCAEIGEVKLKNKTAPIIVYEVTE
ncbi:response regulator [Pontibacter sp. 172403-2]|uniref:adenylate/guanylate cyclase domain-containing protein n=1 Tax=Pontibacter rufus TaxID=2791028 RepID=UPI0018AFBBFD|nr:adenylate/guanylate cyclase domain-containing response regulator [Pontibacter sp. 172403-2]MBF9254929.1 response regulator [Pontibacter sp. 172403-2]